MYAIFSGGFFDTNYLLWRAQKLLSNFSYWKPLTDEKRNKKTEWNRLKLVSCGLWTGTINFGAISTWTIEILQTMTKCTDFCVCCECNFRFGSQNLNILLLDIWEFLDLLVLVCGNKQLVSIFMWKRIEWLISRIQFLCIARAPLSDTAEYHLHTKNITNFSLNTKWTMWLRRNFCRRGMCWWKRWFNSLNTCGSIKWINFRKKTLSATSSQNKGFKYWIRKKAWERHDMYQISNLLVRSNGV